MSTQPYPVVVYPEECVQDILPEKHAIIRKSLAKREIILTNNVIYSIVNIPI